MVRRRRHALERNLRRKICLGGFPRRVGQQWLPFAAAGRNHPAGKP
jgi:hypothetical protein